MDDVTIHLGLDTTEVNVKIDEVMAKADATFQKWAINRAQIMQGISVVNQIMSVTTKIANKVMDETGRAMLRVMSSLLSVVTQTTSTMLSVSAAYASTGILAPIGAALAAFATGFNIGQTAAILQQEEIIKGMMGVVENRLSSLEQDVHSLARGRVVRGF